MRRERIHAMALKEVREIWRDPLYLAMGFLVPIMMMMVLGYGLTFDVENIPFAVLDQDQTPASRELVAKFSDSRYFDLRQRIRKAATADRLLRRSKTRMVLIIPPGFSRDLNRGHPVAVQSLIDGMFPFRADTARGYADAIIGHFNQTRIQRWLNRKEGISERSVRSKFVPVVLQPRYLFNQAIRSEWSMAPGLIMLILSIVPPFLTALGVVREKESGSIYNLYASNITRGEFILGKLVPVVAINEINIFILWGMATWVFGAPFKGNPLLFLLLSTGYILCTASIGLLISILVRTQVAAVLVTMVVSMLPAMLYSGLMVPIDSMGGDAKIVATILPGQHYLNIVWGLFLKDLNFWQLLNDVGAIFVFAVVVWALGFWRFSKRPST